LLTIRYSGTSCCLRRIGSAGRSGIPTWRKTGYELVPETRKVRETKQRLEPSKYLAELDLAADGGKIGGATDRRSSTYVLNSIGLCEAHNSALPQIPTFQTVSLAPRGRIEEFEEPSWLLKTSTTT